MRRVTTPIGLLAFFAASCVHGGVPPPAAERDTMSENLATFRSLWLQPAHIAPPIIDFEPKTTEHDALRVTVTPLLPEDAPWNSWRNGEVRLFNNRAGLLFIVGVDGLSTVRWVPEQTWLEINSPDVRVRASSDPDEFLAPLFNAALDQERYVLEGDLVERTRAAGAYRAEYLSSAEGAPPLSGTIAFPFPEDVPSPIVRVKVVLTLVTSAGPTAFVLQID